MLDGLLRQIGVASDLSALEDFKDHYQQWTGLDRSSISEDERLCICLTVDQYYPPTLGGSAITFRRLAHALAARGHKVAVIAPAIDFQDSTELDGDVLTVRCRSVQPFTLFNQKSRNDVRIAFLPAAIVRQALDIIRPDVINAQFPAYLSRSARTRAMESNIPFVVGCHAIPENYLGSRRHGIPFQAVAKTFWQFAVDFCNQADIVTIPSHTARRLLIDHGLENDAVVISNGVDLGRFHPVRSEAEKREERARLGIPVGVPVILYAGRFTDEKRVDVLIRAMSLVPTPAHLALCGNLSNSISKMIDALGLSERITILGRVPDDTLPTVYRVCDVFALPSEAELQGMVLLEAGASGLPLVGADCLAIPELIMHGENGFLHRPGDEKELAQHLSALAGDLILRKRLGERSIEIVKPHAMDAVVDGVVSLYRSLRAKKASQLQAIA
jgi:1,2-diacylglycerol 3-alpha-glucosyltransferase